MKLTTKIILSIIAAIFLIPLLFIAVFSFTDRRNYVREFSNVKINLSDEKITGIELPSFKTIVIGEVAFVTKSSYSNGLSDNCGIFLDPIPENHSHDMLLIPESLKDYISFDSFQDTLKIKMDLREFGMKNLKDEQFYYYTDLKIRLNLSKIDVISNVLSLSITANNIKTDSMIIKSSGNIYIDSCKADVIMPMIIRNHNQLRINNSDIKKLNLDLDNAGNWRIENCNIEVENLTGGGNHSIKQSKDESAKVYWYPKNKDAQLNVTIKGDAAQIIFP